MQKKSPPDNRQEEPPLSEGRGMPPPAPVDVDAFARRAGEIIAGARASVHKPKRTGSNKKGAVQRMNRSK